MYKFKEEKMNVPTYVWAKEGDIEDGAIEQIKKASSLPFAFHHTCLMPDGHKGYGVPIGGVMASKGSVCINFVGVDIGCGLCCIKTSLRDIDIDTLKRIMGEIRKQIPLGMNHHTDKPGSEEYLKRERILFDLGFDLPRDSCGHMYGVVDREMVKAVNQLGSLGSGNHFISIEKGSNGFIYIMIHSGSRNLGKQVCDYYKDLAYKLNHKWHSNIPEDNKEDYLGFLPIDSEEGQNYLLEMQYCVDFAFANRKLMMDRIKNIFSDNIFGPNDISKFVEFEPMINIAHNYARMENHFGENVLVHRKGATLATKDTIGIIPGSMGTSSYIVKGKGNPESFNSCSHGAGRRLGRKAACKELNLEEEQKKMDGIVHGMRNQDDLEEAPSAYKDIKTVMENQKDLVEILVELTPLGVVKG